MDCSRVRELLSDHHAGRLDGARHAEVGAHLDGCVTCRRAAAVEAELSAALTARLPRHRPPVAFARQLRAQLDEEAEVPLGAPAPASARRLRALAAPFATACAAAALVVLVTRLVPPRAPAGDWALADEAVSDHLRVVASSRPVEIESGGVHQVKPWFTGRLDFAPRVAFGGDDDFPLVGGSVGYVFQRKAAVFVFRRRLHTITLLVFPAQGLSWPPGDGARVGRLVLHESAARGFNVLLWREAELGYGLVSDVNRQDLEALAGKIDGGGLGEGGH